MDNNAELCRIYLARAEYYEAHARELRAEGLTADARDEEDTARDYRVAVEITQATRTNPVSFPLDVRGGL